MDNEILRSTDDNWLNVELLAWTEALSSFESVIREDNGKRAPLNAPLLVAGVLNTLRNASGKGAIDKIEIDKARDQVTALLDQLPSFCESIQTAFSIIFAGRSLEKLVDEAAVIAQFPMSQEERRGLRDSLLGSVETFNGKLAELKQNLESGESGGDGVSEIPEPH